jgi:integrase
MKLKAITLVKSNGYWNASYYCEDNRLRYPTGVKIDSISESDKIKIDRIDDLVFQYITKHRDILKESILADDLYNYLDRILKPGKTAKRKKTVQSLFKSCREYIENMRSGKILKKRTKDRYSIATVNQFGYMLDILEEIAEDSKVPISYSFNMDDFRNLLVWLIGKEYSRNYIYNIVNVLKWCLARTYEMGYHENTFFKNEDFNYVPEESDAVALSLAEIEAVYNLKLTRRWEEKRDFFVWGCFVALRIKDLSRAKEYVLYDNRFEFLSSKTGAKVKVPVHWIAKEIYEKYGGRIPTFKRKALANTLPKICRMAGITKKVLVVMTVGGVKIEQIIEKCDLVQPHTMRRSFCTFMYKELHFKPKQIMPISGHSTEVQFLKYVKIDKEENIEEILSHPAFKKDVQPQSSSDPSAVG